MIFDEIILDDIDEEIDMTEKYSPLPDFLTIKESDPPEPKSDPDEPLPNAMPASAPLPCDISTRITSAKHIITCIVTMTVYIIS